MPASSRGTVRNRTHPRITARFARVAAGRIIHAWRPNPVFAPRLSVVGNRNFGAGSGHLDQMLFMPSARPCGRHRFTNFQPGGLGRKPTDTGTWPRARWAETTTIRPGKSFCNLL